MRGKLAVLGKFEAELRACAPLDEAAQEGLRQQLEEMLATRWPMG